MDSNHCYILCRQKKYNNIGFQEKLAENWQKSPKLVINNIEPRSGDRPV
jgi:hypothetical protein